MSFYGSKNAAFGLAGLDTNGKILLSVLPSGINANLLADGSVSNTEFQYLDGVTSNIQAQFNAIYNGGTSFEANACAAVNVNISNPGTAVFDGITLTNGQTLFLLPTASGGAQTTASQGGLWTFNGSGSALTRLSTMNTWEQIAGSIVYVNAGGATYGSTVWRNTNQVAGGTINVTSVTYMEQQSAYIGGTGVNITGNVISIGQTVGITDSVTFNAMTLTSNTNFMYVGASGASVQFTAPILTGDRTANIPDANSTMVVAAAAPSLNFMTGINIDGTIAYGQPSLAGLSDVTITSPQVGDAPIYDGTDFANAQVIDQILTSLSPVLGNILITDSIVEAISKLSFSYNTTAATVSTNSAVPLGQVITNVNTDGLTITAPNATTMKIGDTYTVANIGGTAITTIVAAFSGQSIGSSATFTISGLANSCSFRSDGANLQLV